MTPTLLNNRYQVIQTLGAGGFGTTFLAEDMQMPSKRKCVIKQLKPITNNPEIYQLVQERFQREAAILEELGDANSQIPRLYAYFSEVGQFYLIQEWVEGLTLRDKVQAEGAIAEAIAKQILIDILPVLHYVHGQRIVHRDIKPDNIILRKRDNKPVLIDFGAVRETMGTVVNSQGNASSIVIGTPGFMPSEQAAGRPMYSSDLYSLGLTMIYMLTAKFPQELDLDPRTGDITWRSYAHQVSPAFANLLDKAIQYHPRDRYATAEEMLAALNGIAESSTPPLAPTLPPQSFAQSFENKSASASITPGNVPNTIIGAQTPQTIYQDARSVSQPLVAQSTNLPAKEMPNEILGWNWGAFLMPGLWCLSNQVWIGLLAWTGTFTAGVGWLVAAGLLGAKGNEWAWKSRRWRSVEAFKSHQRTWAIAGSVVWGSFISLFGLLIVIAIVNPKAFETPEDGTVPQPLSSGQSSSADAQTGAANISDASTTNVFGISEPLNEPTTNIDGIWKLQLSANSVAYDSTLTMQGINGTMTTKFVDSGTGETKSIEQTMRLWASPRGLVVLGYSPIDLATKTADSTYRADNLLFEQTSDGLLQVTNCNDAGVCSNVIAEKVSIIP